MCIAIAAKIVSISKENNTARAVLDGNELDINISLIDPSEGDYVLVHAGCGIEIVKEEIAIELLDLYRLIQEAAAE